MPQDLDATVPLRVDIGYALVLLTMILVVVVLVRWALRRRDSLRAPDEAIGPPSSGQPARR